MELITQALSRKYINMAETTEASGKMVKITVKTPKEKKEIELESNASIEKVILIKIVT